MTDIPVQTLDQEDYFDWCEKAICELAQSKGITTEECERRFRNWNDTLHAFDILEDHRLRESEGSALADFLPSDWE